MSIHSSLKSLYPDLETRSISKLINGRGSKTFLIATKNQNYILKQCFQSSEISNLKKVIKFLHHFQNKFNFEIPNPLKNRLGEKISKEKKFHYWIYAEIKGKNREKLNKKKVINLLKVLKEFRKKTKKHLDDFPFREHKFISKTQENLIKKEIFEYNGSSKYKKAIHDIFVSFPLNKLNNLKIGKPCLSHGDFNFKNTLFNKDRVVGIIDFETLSMKSPLEDISYLLKMIFIEYPMSIKINTILDWIFEIFPDLKNKKNGILESSITNSKQFLSWKFLQKKSRKNHIQINQEKKFLNEIKNILFQETNFYK